MKSHCKKCFEDDGTSVFPNSRKGTSVNSKKLQWGGWKTLFVFKKEDPYNNKNKNFKKILLFERVCNFKYVRIDLKLQANRREDMH